MQRPFVVLQSFQKPRPTTNPYVIQLADRLSELPGVEVLNWSWRAALLGRYDVVHAHWPEVLVDGRTPARKLIRQLLFTICLLRIRILRIPLVQTMHNLELPQGISRREVLLLRLAQRWTTLRVAINATTPQNPNQAWALIPHGHYRDWFAAIEPAAQVRGRIAYFGRVRRYKAVDRLVRAFVSDEGLLAECTLHIAGNPSTDELVNELRALSKGDPRITMRFGFIDDPELVEVVTQSELVVLPYSEMHNSGATLTALSLGRPVLVPDNEANRALAAEVGPEWLLTFDGELDAATLHHALTQVRSHRGAAPNLSSREWADAGARHVAAYRQSAEIAARRPIRQLFGRG